MLSVCGVCEHAAEYFSVFHPDRQQKDPIKNITQLLRCQHVSLCYWYTMEHKEQFHHKKPTLQVMRCILKDSQ